MPEFIYQMRAVRKAHGDKVILDDVTLAFLPGAKIGVVGPNGTGKSTLLRIMAGLEQPSNGDARLMPGYTVGILEQEPRLDEDKTVLGNVEEGVAETKALVDRYNEIAETDGRRLLRRASRRDGRASGAARPPRMRWDLDSQLEQAMDALRCPPPDAESGSCPAGSGAASRCASCCSHSRICCCSTSRPTISTPRACSGWSSISTKYPGTVVAVTHDRYFLDNVARWILELDRGRAHPYEGNYSTYLENKAARIKVEGPRTSSGASALRRSSSGSGRAPRARQAKSRARLAPVRGDGRRGG